MEQISIVQSMTIKKEVSENETKLLSISMNISGNPERFTTFNIKKEPLSTNVDQSRTSSSERKDETIASIPDHVTSHIKEELLDYEINETSRSFMETNEFNPLLSNIDIKKEVFKSEPMDVRDSGSLKSSLLTQFKLENGLQQGKADGDSDLQKSSRSMFKDSPDSEADVIRCNYCNKEFATRSHLRSHLRTHTGEKPFKCDYCGKKFAQNCNLKSHLLTHTGEKPFQCDQCHKGFTRKNTLQSHLLTHTGEKPFECEYCARGFAWKRNLKLHLLTHTGEKSFICHYCHKGFALKKNMLSHSLTHTKEKPFKCDYCEKKFTRKQHCQSHLLIHARGNLYLNDNKIIS